MKTIAVLGITGYQHWISPHMHRQCGLGMVGQNESCSVFAKHVIEEQGFYRGLALSRLRFEECKYLGVKNKK